MGVAAFVLCACSQASQGAESVADETASGAEMVLPLKRGFYVREDIACEGASNASLMLHQADGFSYARSFCAIESVERLDQARYRTTERCEPLVGQGEPAFTRTMTYVLTGDDAFLVEGSYAPGARFCPQRTLPEPWRSNDVPGIDE